MSDGRVETIDVDPASPGATYEADGDLASLAFTHTVTLANAATIAGAADRLGSLDKGKIANVIVVGAYALVGRARTRVDSARQQIAGTLADADSIRVSMLGAEYTFVTQTYRRSGCRA